MRVVASIAAPAFVGQKVKVKAPITVFHVPKTKGAATQLQGLTGTVAALADVHTDGTLLSCTMPLKVELSVSAPDGAPVKFMAHLTVEEVELL